MDLGTIVGIFLGIGLIISAIGVSGLGGFIDIPSILVVGGGTIAASLVMYPLSTLLGSFKVGIKVVTVKLHSPDSTIEKLVELSNKVRKDSVLALESETFDDEFLGKGVRMCVDGTNVDSIKSVLAKELEFLRNRHKLGAQVFDSMGMLAPAWGMIGTLIGLVQMLQNLSDPSSIGPAMAIALLTTFYGALAANFVFIPFAGKLEQRSTEETVVKEIIIEGIASIAKEENPMILKDKLQAFLAPALRKEES